MGQGIRQRRPRLQSRPARRLGDLEYDDKEFSFTDCTSFVVMERLGLLYAFAFDEHFEQTGQFIRVPAP